MAIHRGNCGRSLVPCMAICLNFMASIVDGAKPAAVSVPVRTNWLGYDGNWSPISLMVGTPAQWIDVFVSTASQETWVVGSGGCDGTITCQNKRGGLFRNNESSTWDTLGIYDLGLDPQLGFGGFGSYGLDTVGFTDDVSLPSQIVGVINTTDYWAGYLGLGIKPTNFTDANQPTFLTSMVENQSLIPSHSYGYTAGAYYRLKSVPASLTLGGFDANRFQPHGISFDLDPAQNPVVALNAISVTAAPLATSNVSLTWPSESVKLLDSDNTGLYTIDSSTPYLWLPESVCLRFEKALGLTYDEQLGLYTFAGNETQHQALVSWNMTFNFDLFDLPGSSKMVSLSVPYAAFDLKLTYPFPGLNATQFSAPTNYFPVRKAANSTQYTIGRAFLQETYLTVDYERNNFSISQANFYANAINNKHLVGISRPKNSTFGGPAIPTANNLSKSAIAGIAVGAVVLGVALLSLGVVCVSHRRQSKSASARGASKHNSRGNVRLAQYRFWRRLFAIPKPDRAVEIDGRIRQPNEAPSQSEIKELPADTYSELVGSEVQIPPYEETRRKLNIKIVNAPGHDPSKPVEADDQCTPSELFQQDEQPRIPKPIVSPPYSPSHVGTHFTPTTEISSRSRGSRESSQLSSPAIISPLTPRFGMRTGWMGNTDQYRNQEDGSDGEANPHLTHQGSESISDNEQVDAQHHNQGPEGHKFSWEEQR